MKYYVNECVGCPPEMGCLGSTCPNRHVSYWKCDICNEDGLSEDDMYDDSICNVCSNEEGLNL